MGNILLKPTAEDVAMSAFAYRIADGITDFNAVAEIWPKRFGDFQHARTVQRLLSTAIRDGALVLTSTTEGQVVAAIVLNLTNYENTLFIPFVLISPQAEDRQELLSAQFELMLKVLILSGAQRLMIVRNTGQSILAAIPDFNARLQKAGVPLHMDVVGQAKNLYGDDRDVTFCSLFIPPQSRPDLMANVTAAASTIAVGEIELMKEHRIADFCSGCKEGKGEKDSKEYKERKDGKDEKDTDQVVQKAAAVEADVPGVGDKLSAEMSSAFSLVLLEIYRQAGVTYPEAENAPASDRPLV
jgi:hypothetical protein